MEVASLVVGIIAAILGVAPCCPILGIILGLVSAILGIVVLVKKKGTEEPKGKAIAGLVLGVVAIIGAIIWTVLGSASMLALFDSANSLSNSSSFYNY